MTDWLPRARAITPGGSQTLSKCADRYVEGACPVIAANGRGAYLQGYLPDGSPWHGIDWVGALGAAPLGYAHPAVVEAVNRQLDDGWLFSIPHRLEVEVSERFCAAVPAGKNGKIRWTKTGTEACMGAVAIARSYTGRDLVLTTDQSYHGWSDIFRVTKPVHPGAPEFLKQGVGVFPYNDSDVLEHADWDRVALVMMEPCLMDAPLPGFLESIVELAHEHGALVCFDEMILGGRMRYGGGSEYFAVTPDLACYGKAIGGGYPVACVVGRRDVMEQATVVSGTFCGDALALAAVDAVMDAYEHGDACFDNDMEWARPIERIWRAGRQLQDGFNGIAARLGVPAKLEGAYPFRLRAVFDCSEPRLALSLFVQEMAARNVLWAPSGINPGAAHGPKEISITLDAIGPALAIIGCAIHENNYSGLRGRPYRDAFRSASANVPT